MAEEFQPEHPHPESKSSTTFGGVLTAVMLLAFLTPRWSADASVNWWVTLGGGVLALLIALGVGMTRRG